jgi:hypothetical protein
MGTSSSDASVPVDITFEPGRRRKLLRMKCYGVPVLLEMKIKEEPIQLLCFYIFTDLKTSQNCI